MTERDVAGMPDGRDLVAGMGWKALPYGCVGMTRKAVVDANRTAWSWLILIPWAMNDAKPWIDGTQILGPSLDGDAEQENNVFQFMRELLDKRYGESVGRNAAEQIERMLRDS